jgi:predicted transcriptional regulator
MFGGEEALEHKTRKQIFNYISTHQGVSFGVIREFFDLNESTLKYHLHYLEKNRRITSSRRGRQRLYFCDGMDTEVGETTFQFPQMEQQQQKVKQLNLSLSQQRVLNIIKRQPGIGKKELMTYSKMSRKTLGYNINKLIENNLIWKVKNAGVAGYEFITKEKLRKEIYNRLLMKLLADEISEEKFLKIKKKLETMDVDEI